MSLYPLAIQFNKIWKCDQGMVSNETVHLKFLINNNMALLRKLFHLRCSAYCENFISVYSMKLKAFFDERNKTY